MKYSEEKISRTCNINEAYENLANAIVKQAVVDYKEPLRKLEKNPNDKEAKRDAERIERFFHSGWYTQLTGIDGDWLIRKRISAGQRLIRKHALLRTATGAWCAGRRRRRRSVRSSCAMPQ